jgi:hypothetical protein
VSATPEKILTEKPAADPEAGGGAKLVPALLVPALLVALLLGIAGAFWFLNGASVFAQLVASAWALCF